MSNTSALMDLLFAGSRQKVLAQLLLEPEVELHLAAIFRNTQGAAACVTGRTANGWIEWKDGDGRTLGERKATPVEEGAAV